MRKWIAFSVVTVMMLPNAASASSISGTHGEILTITKTSGIKLGEKLTIQGSRFDETVGIYIEMCQIVAKGVRPSVCGGGADKTGSSGASVWISSNPPNYGIGLALPYKAGGRFSTSIKVSAKIGKIDCHKAKCAIYVRADHTRGDDRTYDMYLPISFK
ncbi:MAG: hypothetical protein WCH42_01695 [Actinomycetes bacterium]